MNPSNYNSPETDAQFNVRTELARTKAGSIKSYFGVDKDGLILCPFHDDHNPSASIHIREGKERIKCHTCGVSEDIFGVIERLEGRKFIEIVNELAPRGDYTRDPRLKNRTVTSKPSTETQNTTKPGKKKTCDNRSEAPTSIKIFSPALNESVTLGSPDPVAYDHIKKTWRRSTNSHKSGQRDELATIKKRLGPHAGTALDKGLLRICVKDQVKRREYKKNNQFYTILIPQYQCLPPTQKMSEPVYPCDIECRALDPTAKPKALKWRGACPNTARTFGRMDEALQLAQGRELLIVEGDFNSVTYQLALGDSCGVIGIPGAKFSTRVAAVLDINLALIMKDENRQLPEKIIIDFDHDEAGQEAGNDFYQVAKFHGIPVFRTVRIDATIDGVNKKAIDANDLLQLNWDLEDILSQDLVEVTEPIEIVNETRSQYEELSPYKRRGKTIYVFQDIHQMVLDLEGVIVQTDSCEMFQRFNRLVEIIDGDILEVGRARLDEIASNVAQWFIPASEESKKGPRPVLPPKRVIEAFRTRNHWNELPELKGIVDCPTLRDDGTVLTEKGYDEASGLYYQSSVDFPEIPEAPTLEEVRAALEILRQPFREFPYVSGSDESSSMGSILTGFAIHFIQGPVPMWITTAPAPGTGKSLIVFLIGIILTGEEPEIISHSTREEEEEKRITGLLSQGCKIALIDNVEQPLGSSVMASLLTSRFKTARMLGSNHTPKLRNDCLWFGSGNNLTIKGDLHRRVTPIRLDANVEAPEERKGFKIENLMGWTKEHRPELVSAALTILRGYIAAGSPKHNWKPFGSFEGWSDLIRGCLCWLGLPDPLHARDEFKESSDVGTEDMKYFFDLWWDIYQSRPVYLCDLRKQAEQSDQLSEAIAAIDPGSSNDRINTKSLAGLLRRWAGRPLGGGKKLVNRRGSSRRMKWILELTERPKAERFPENLEEFSDAA